MPRFAALDCGTNSLRLLISDFHLDGDVLEGTELARLNEIVRLGQGVDATGRISDEALRRVKLTLARYIDLMLQENVQAVRMVATSASRDAENRDDFFNLTADMLGEHWPGVKAEVISGAEEAALSFRGAVEDLSPEDGPFCVVDLGGGSTEVIVGDYHGDIAGAYSANMGCVRITERLLLSDPPTEEEIAAAREFIAEQMADVRAAVPLAKTHTLVGCAGTFTTLSAVAQGLETYDPQAIHMSRLRFEALRSLCGTLLATPKGRRAADPVIHPGRADVIGGGALVVEAILDTMSAEAGLSSIVISEKDLLDGIVAGLVDEHLH
ncbi:Ppx/GppA phosphatase family protein [Corynebacterium ulceribovis]|uniref:Ppx/GppA phosphatase family protein n=1 Tax=Corynebacterium ulceribovis TaxID=487732 RepID=UPI0003A60BFB|nr:Ppx/GppA phosphatase family protein [Corynebacterium ulceribovis]